MLKKKKKFPFEKGFDEVQGGEQPKIKAELMKGLKITTRAAWGKRLKGEVEPTISEAKFIEKVFSKRGITDVWGIGRKSRQRAKESKQAI